MNPTKSLIVSTLSTVIIVISILPCPVRSAVIHESATMGPAGQVEGYGIDSTWFIGSRFRLDQPADVTAVGGHMLEWTSGDFFGAIVTLDSITDLPDGLPFNPAEVVASVVLDPGVPSSDFRIPLSVTLPAGYYAIIFGSGRFGSTPGTGAMPYSGQVDLPGASYILWDGSGWWNSASGQMRFVVEGNLVPAYCSASGACGWEYISNVRVAAIDNSSACTDYTDNTHISTETEIGQSYVIDVTSTDGYSTDECGIWVDWNQDLDFDDPGETIAVTGNPGVGPYTAMIAPPVGALPGDTRMRVRILDGSFDTMSPCGLSLYGEVEDYTLNIIDSQKYSGGDGNEANPYKIANAADLLELRESTDDYDKHFIQIADVSLSGAGDAPDGTFSNAVIAGSTTGSGFNGVAFQGVYDGNGFTVSDLAIDATTSWYDYLGLFGKVHNGLIKNLKLNNVSIDGQYILYVGGVAGFNDGGTIRNCNSSVAFVGGINSSYFGGIAGYNDDHGLIEECSSGGSMSGSIGKAGGLAGRNDYYSVIRDCNSSCSVDGNIYLGGLVGINSLASEILDSYATGNITGASLYYYVGGLVGDNDCSISDCYATGTVSGNREVGGLAGRNYSDGTIVNCYATGQVDGVENVGGLVGINEFVYPGVILHCYAAGDVSGTTAVGGFCGYNQDNHLADPVPIIVNCFWNTTVQTHGVTEGIGINSELVLNVLGRTTSQMQMQSTFTDYSWDFTHETVNGTEDTWHMPYVATGFPMLWWQRDILGDWIGKYGVGFEDYALLAENYMNINQEVNLSGLDIIDFKDLAVFSGQWLAGR